MSTPSSCIARTSSVPVTARPSGVVLKYVLPAVVMWNAPHCSATRPSCTSSARQSTSRASSAPYSLARSGTPVEVGLVGLAEVGGVACTGSRPARASTPRRPTCRARRRRRCRPARRRAATSATFAHGARTYRAASAIGGDARSRSGRPAIAGPIGRRSVRPPVRAGRRDAGRAPATASAGAGDRELDDARDRRDVAEVDEPAAIAAERRAPTSPSSGSVADVVERQHDHDAAAAGTAASGRPASCGFGRRARATRCDSRAPRCVFHTAASATSTTPTHVTA